MDFNSLHMKQIFLNLKQIDFELAYLVLLTCQGLKPLSRWEKPLADNELASLQQIAAENELDAILLLDRVPSDVLIFHAILEYNFVAIQHGVLF